MSDHLEPAELVARLRSAAGGLAGLAPGVAAGEPWPLSNRFGTEPEARWGPPETLAHVAEMIPFWQGEMERVLARDPEPVPFGRVAADPLRIGVIERDRSLPARELFARIDAGVDRFAARLAELGPAEVRRVGVHPTLGEMTLMRIAERFVVGHLEEHASQLRESLGTRG